MKENELVEFIDKVKTEIKDWIEEIYIEQNTKHSLLHRIEEETALLKVLDLITNI
jgi:hypothetical protein